MGAATYIPASCSPRIRSVSDSLYSFFCVLFFLFLYFDLTDLFCTDLFRDRRDKVIQRLLPFIAQITASDGHNILLFFLCTYDKMCIRDRNAAPKSCASRPPAPCCKKAPARSSRSTAHCSRI